MEKVRCPLCCNHELDCSDLKQHVRTYVKGRLECPFCHCHVRGASALLYHLDTHDLEINSRLTSRNVPIITVKGELLDDGSPAPPFVNETDVPEPDAARERGAELAEIIHDAIDVKESVCVEFNPGSLEEVCSPESLKLSELRQNSLLKSSQSSQLDTHQKEDWTAGNLLNPGGSESILLGGSTEIVFLYSCNFCPQHFNTVEHLQQHGASVHAKDGVWQMDVKQPVIVTIEKIPKRLSTKMVVPTPETAVTVVVGPVQKSSMEPNVTPSVNDVQNVVVEEDVVMHSQVKTNELESHGSEHESKVEENPIQNICDQQKKFRPRYYIERKIHLTRDSFATTCDICHGHFETYVSIKRHSFTHSELGCKECGEHFMVKGALARHVGAVHGSDAGVYMCDTCRTPFHTFKTYRDHLLSAHNMKLGAAYSCDRCKVTFKESFSLAFHLEQVHPEPRPVVVRKELRRHGCPCCDKRLCNRTQLESHLKRVHGKGKHTCHLCNKVFLKFELLRAHYKRHTNEKPFKCKQCPDSFKTKRGLLYHEASHLEEKAFKCDQCDKTFKGKPQLQFHVRNHKRSVACDECDGMFKSRYALLVHKDDAHQDQSVRDYKCEECSRTYFLKSQLTAHRLAVHHKAKSHICPSCDKRYSSKSMLNLHMQGHVATKPFVCDVCNKGFLRASVLKAHYRYHTGEQPFKCDVCLATFFSRRTLLTHKSRHLDLLTFECPQCTKAFPSRNLLCAHIRTHNRNYKCQICKRGFCQRAILESHVFTHGKDYKCKKCLKHLPSAKVYRAHQQYESCTADPRYMEFTSEFVVAKEYKCKKCHTQFPTARTYGVHRRSKSCTTGVQQMETTSEAAPVKDHRCETCLKQFPSARAYATHKRSKSCSLAVKHVEVTSEVVATKDYRCKTCLQQFSTAKLYRSHQRSKSCTAALKRMEVASEIAVTKDYKCDRCLKQFSSARACNAHQRLKSCTTYLQYMEVASEIVV